MTDKKLKLIVGALLHDIGKVLYRADDHRNHSESGYHFVLDETNMSDKEVIDQIRYHHAAHMKNATLNQDALAYVTYIADNISSAMDRREKTDGALGFVRNMPLSSIFNILNNNNEQKSYQPMMLDQTREINFPTDKKITYSEGFYSEVRERIRMCLEEYQWNDEYINSLLSILEATLSYIPSSTSTKEIADISLYDHVKMTAAIACCIYDYMEEKGIVDYRNLLYKNAKEFYKEKAFMIYSMDISGIQDFIYTINSKGALKGLRSRSFYLEIMMEHLVDELLFNLELSRANLIYTGGGHAYLLLPNTSKTKNALDNFEDATNAWFLENFGTALFVAGGYGVCSAEELYDTPKGSYRKIFQNISESISERKLNRYTPKQIIYLNHHTLPDGERECKICGRTDKLHDDNKCNICWSLEKMSKQIMHGDFFTITKKDQDLALPLPGDCYLIADNNKALINRMKTDDYYVRAYSKNKLYSGYSLSTNLWVGDYASADTFEELAEVATGFKRIAVMRADVDNLGQAFVRGFENKNLERDYVTLSRTATFSRKLSLFFKYHMNQLLEEGCYYFTDNTSDNHKRNALIVYSGGDDIFLIGSWDDVIGFAIDLYEALNEFSQGKLSISAGISLYPAKFPIAVMAQETGKLEDAAKSLPGKNGVTLFNSEYTFHWEELIENVLEEKLELLKEYFNEYQEKGKNFLYNMLDLIRARKEDRINIARYAYLLGRIAPDKKEEKTSQGRARKELYDRFSKQMYQWIRNDKDAKELEMAIYLYVYMNRESEA